MKTNRGFTIVELIITITILAILMTLAVVNLRSTQVQARDAERKSDIGAMAKRLDALYKRGFPAAAGSLRGSYPITSQMADDTTRKAIFKDLPAGVMYDPAKDGTVSITVASNTNTGITSGSGAVTPFPSSSMPYVYQPIADNGSLCDDLFNKVCRKFNFYAWQENTPNTAYKIESQYR